VAAEVSKEVQKELEKFKPYSPVLLCSLVKNMDLNGQCGVVVPQSCSLSPEVPGCLKVRLESGREVAVKPQNVQPVEASAPAPLQAASQEQALQQVLAQMQQEATKAKAPPPAAEAPPAPLAS